jgi:hypothetical protein
MGKRNLKDMEWYSMDWIYMVQSRGKWSAVVHMVMNLRDSQNAGNLLSKAKGKAFPSQA